MADETLRRTRAAAIRTVLEEGLRQAEDPVAYLRTAAGEVRQLVTLFEVEADHGGSSYGAMIHAMLADEVEIAAEELIRRLHH